MEDMEDREVLSQGARELGLELGQEALTRLLAYAKELEKWNTKINLVARGQTPGLLTRHILDSLVPCRVLAGSHSCLDMGTGAGLPGIPLKIALPGLRVVLMDSKEKKVHFLRHVIRMLGLEDIEAVLSRAEDRGAIEKYGLSLDAVISRAFSDLSEFVSLGLPYIKDHGMIIAVKGPRTEALVKEAHAVPRVRVEEIIEQAVPFSDRRTSLVIFKRSV